jgi:AraC-like DNA-binding protein
LKSFSAEIDGILFKFERVPVKLYFLMIAELEKISYDDGGGFIAEYITDTGGMWHFHPEYELVLNIKSNGTRIVGDSVELFDQYDMVLVAGNIPHSWNYYKHEKDLPDKHGIMVHFRQSSLGDALLGQHEMHCVRELLEQAERGIGFSVEDAKKAEKHLVEMTGNAGIEKMIDFFNVIRIMCQSEKKILLCSENYKQAYDERGNKKMADVYTYVRENYFKPVSLEKVSKIVHMSPFAFSRFFKKNSGAGFVEYVNRVRTNKACYLLRETEYQIHDIAVECGFESISNFNKQFRKTEGISPRDYRAQYR